MRILIVRNNYNPKALESALLLEVYLASQGVECTAFDTDDLRASSEFFQRKAPVDASLIDAAVLAFFFHLREHADVVCG